MNYIKWWKQVFLSIFIVAFLFIVWDIIFTRNGVWGFNNSYLTGLYIFNLPIEEWLFFICIPYASIFIHYAFQHFFPNIRLSVLSTRTITIALILLISAILILNLDKAYTFYNYGFLLLILVFCLFTKNKELEVFYLTFLIILIPFFIVNGILTGSFIPNEVVWYNDLENLGIRIGTIPIEDIGYAFNMLFLNILLIEKFKSTVK
ncbi:lycopene cyclase domain-containing protein [Saonia flava]|uniref:Lycopene cyclase domain-containing protein n=2 Tax=Saonia flava TaxID=523696 RepID=A0A846QWZ2_9FLAO|nr:lycopene cyclase domain-containing protein [Saonia flava]